MTVGECQTCLKTNSYFCIHRTCSNSSICNVVVNKHCFLSVSDVSPPLTLSVESTTECSLKRMQRLGELIFGAAEYRDLGRSPDFRTRLRPRTANVCLEAERHRYDSTEKSKLAATVPYRWEPRYLTGENHGTLQVRTKVPYRWEPRYLTGENHGTLQVRTTVPYRWEPRYLTGENHGTLQVRTTVPYRWEPRYLIGENHGTLQVRTTVPYRWEPRYPTGENHATLQVRTTVPYRWEPRYLTGENHGTLQVRTTVPYRWEPRYLTGENHGTLRVRTTVPYKLPFIWSEIWNLNLSVSSRVRFWKLCISFWNQ